MVAGPNGSGKTTLTRALRARGVDFGDYVNPDDISRDLSRETFPDQYSRDREAQARAERRRRDALAAGRSLSYETVMSHPSHLAFMREAKARGYEVHLFFVGVSNPAINVARVAQRVALGGHDVPAERTVGRYWRVMEGLAEAVLTADRAEVFDNSGSGEPPRVVARREGDRLVVLKSGLPRWVRNYLVEPVEAAGRLDVVFK